MCRGWSGGSPCAVARRLWVKPLWSALFASEFSGFEHDEVFVDGLQRGVGEAGCAVEDGPSYEHHVEPFDQGACG